MIKRLEDEEKKAKGENTDENRVSKKIEKHETKWKQKFIRIWKYTEELQKEMSQKEMEQSVGPSNFNPIMKLGSGSFG